MPTVSSSSIQDLVGLRDPWKGLGKMFQKFLAFMAPLSARQDVGSAPFPS